MGLKKTLNEWFEVEYRKEVWFSPFGFLQHVLPALQKRGDPEFVKDGAVWTARLWAAGHIRNEKAAGPTLYEAAARLLAADIEREKVVVSSTGNYINVPQQVGIPMTVKSSIAESLLRRQDEMIEEASRPLFGRVKAQGADPLGMLNAEIENRYSAKTEPHARP